MEYLAKDFLLEKMRIPIARDGKITLDDKNMVELYKFVKIGLTPTSLDPRGDRNIKYTVLHGIRKSLDDNSIAKERIEKIKSINNLCLKYYFDPLKLTKEAREFYKKYPGAIF